MEVELNPMISNWFNRLFRKTPPGIEMTYAQEGFRQFNEFLYSLEQSPEFKLLKARKEREFGMMEDRAPLDSQNSCLKCRGRR